MKSRSKVELRRCRPLLGTLVEIAAAGTERARLERAVERAFAAVAKVHRLMSFHDSESDVSHMNRAAFPKGVAVHPWTWRVMRFAQTLARESQGIFDVTIGSLLTDWNYLPQCGYYSDRRASAGDIFLRRNWTVFFRRQLTVDLGGIAKGFAVDRAVEALGTNGATSGVVNAGGDIRVFGREPQLVHLRNPGSPTQPAGVIRLRERALATSATYFSRRQHEGKPVSPLIDGRVSESVQKSISVSVAADDCMTADALTKVVFALGEEAAPLLARYGANAVA